MAWSGWPGMTMPESWPDRRVVAKIAFALLDRSVEERGAILQDAFEHACAQNPNVAVPPMDPRILRFVAAIFRQIEELEMTGGNA
jgi:hypothetical protein